MGPAKSAKCGRVCIERFRERSWALSLYYILFLLMEYTYYLATLAEAPDPAI